MNVESTGPIAVVSDDWLEVVSTEIRGATRANLATVNSCISTSRIAQEVLTRAGLNARAQPVWVTAFNREAMAMVMQGTPPPAWPDTAWSVGIDETQPATSEGGWNGHLVVILRRPGLPRMLMDLTADQFSRPSHGIVLDQPVMHEIRHGELFTPKDPSWGTYADTEVTMAYRPMASGHPSAKVWKTTHDWRLPQKTLDFFVGAILAKTGGPR